MATVSKKVLRKHPARSAERTVVYRGIKIAPMTGKRSKLAKTLRDALQAKSEKPSGQPVRG